MKLFLAKIVLFAVFILIDIQAFSQTRELRGKVYDDFGPLIGASVRIKGTDIGAHTDSNGEFVLRIPSNGKIILEFACMGKETEFEEVKGRNRIEVYLEDSMSALQEAVVKPRANINAIDFRAKTGSVAEVDIVKMKSKPVASIGLALQGAVPGLQVINKGELGTKPEIRIRGVSSLRKGDLPNEPLYVLDGQVITPEAFFYLNPDDIKSIKILKDAVATALYGIKAANGVIEITSTRGINGERELTYNTKTGITFPQPQSPKMMGTAEKLELERLLRNPSAPGYLYSEDYIRRFYSSSDNMEELIATGKNKLDSLSKINTNWFDKLLRTTLFQSHTLSMRGGNDASSYYTSFGYTSQGGQVKGNDYQRFSGRMSLNHQLSKQAVIGLGMNASYAKTDTPNGSNYDVSSLVYDLNPYESENSPYLYSFPNGGTLQDLLNQYKSISKDKSFEATSYLNYNVTKNLEISAVAGIDFTLRENLSVIPPTAFSEIRSGKPVGARGSLTQEKNTTFNATANVRATYHRQFGKHDFVTGGNIDTYITSYDNINISGNGLFGKMISGASIDNSLEGNYRPHVGAKKEEIRNVGVGFLAGYTFDSAYDLSFVYKLDASSVLPKSKRNNVAWAFGGGVDFKRYLPDTKWVKSLKLRGSYGYTANLQGISMQNTLPTLGISPDGYNQIRKIYLLSLPNQELRAEKNDIIDYGFKISIFSTELDVSFYNRVTRDALLDVPIASSNGFASQWRNIGVLSNSGVEFSVYQRLIDRGDWFSTARLSFAYNKNKVISLYDRDRLYTNPDSKIPDYEVGKPVDIIYGLKTLGINPISGEPVFRKADGSEAGIHSNFAREDFIALGHSTPPISGSFTYNLSYRNLELDMDFYYTLGGKRAYRTTYIRGFDNANKNAARGQLGLMWFNVGDEDKRYPSPFVTSGGAEALSYPTDRTVGSTDMLRLNSMSLRYRFSSKVLQRFGGFIKSGYCAIQASNLFTISRFGESDPESGGIVAPLQSIVTFSINLTI